MEGGVEFGERVLCDLPGGFEFLNLAPEGGFKGGFFALQVVDSNFKFGDGFFVLILGGTEIFHNFFFSYVLVFHLLDLDGQTGVIFL